MAGGVRTAGEARPSALSCSSGVIADPLFDAVEPWTCAGNVVNPCRFYALGGGGSRVVGIAEAQHRGTRNASTNSINRRALDSGGRGYHRRGPRRRRADLALFPPDRGRR